MATKKEYKDFILEQLSGMEKITCRQMMGEYLLYRDKILFGGIYDNRLLVKKTERNAAFGLEEVLPYESARPMYSVCDVDDAEKLKIIVETTCEDIKNSKR